MCWYLFNLLRHIQWLIPKPPVNKIFILLTIIVYIIFKSPTNLVCKVVILPPPELKTFLVAAAMTTHFQRNFDNEKNK